MATQETACPVVILAGGKGTRLREKTESLPKPMVTIGGRPILWHIMRIYSHFGFNRFIIALGYRGDMIKEYFCNYDLLNHNVTVDLRTGNLRYHHTDGEKLPWTVTLLDTGLETPTGGRIKRVAPHIHDSYFMATYGDGIADIDIQKLVEFLNASSIAMV